MTTLEECYNVIGGGANGADVVRRLGSEASLKKYLGRLLDDQNYETLRQALDESDAEQAFRCAHSIKGICQNFDLNVLGASSAALTEALRGGVIGPDAEAEIVADYVNCGVDYVFGGGSKLFENRADGRDLFKELREKGYQTPRSWEELAKIQKGKVFCVTDTVDTPLPAERGDLLARASMKAIDLLGQNPEGFFLMVEGSQLDDYGHFNDIDLLMQETHDFDRTIGRIFEWAAQDGETLVVVTADHETGGLTLVDGDLNEGRIVCKFSTGGHSGVMVPVYAFGPGAENFTGIFENTDIFWKIKKLLNL